MVSRATTSRCTPRSATSPISRRRRSRRGQHVGHRAGGRRRRARRRRPGSSSTSRPSCPAGCGWSSRDGRCRRCDRLRSNSPAPPTVARLADGTAIDLLRPAAGSQPAVAGADRRRRRPARPCSSPSAGRSATRTSSATGRSAPTRPCSPIEPGSAEMPSAARPFTAEIVTALVRRGIGIATITLHTGVSSLEGHELPYPERFRVPAATAAAVNATHAAGGHVIAVGTTVVRALESAVDDQRHRASRRPAGPMRSSPRRGRAGRRRPALGMARTRGHPPGDARSGRRARPRSSPRTRRHGRAATCGTSSATAICCFPTLEIDDVDERHEPATGGSAEGGVVGATAPADRAARRAVRRSPARRCDRRRHRRALGITVSGARQHLTALADHGLVATDELRRRPAGTRPAPAVVHVTELADALFPKAYAALTNELLGYLADEDGKTVDRLFARRRDDRIATPSAGWRRKRSLGAKVAELAQILDEDGYIATAEPIGREPLPHRRAQLRDRLRRPTLRPGLLQRDRLHPCGAARAPPSSARSTWWPATATAPTTSAPRSPVARCLTRAAGGAQLSPGAERGRGSRRRARARGGGSRRAPCWRAPDGP